MRIRARGATLKVEVTREGEAPAEPQSCNELRLGRSLALPYQWPFLGSQMRRTHS